MKKVTIYTLADNRPDFIPLQYETLKKFIKDDYEYVIVDNCINSKKRSRIIEEICKSLGIRYMKVQLDRNVMNEYGQIVTTFLGNYKHDSMGVSYGFNFIWKQICKENQGKIFVLMDSDMFPCRPISWNEELGEKDAAFVYQYRGISEDGGSAKVAYPWNALCIFNPDKIKNLKDMNWNSGIWEKDYIEGYAVDTAGYIHYWMKENKVDVKHISEYAIHDWKKENDRVWIDAVLNGNFHYSFEYKIGSMIYSNFQVYEKNWQKLTAEKILPHFPENFDKVLPIKTIKYFEQFLLNKQTFPDPSFIGFLEFETFNENIDPVTVHHKAGGGYMGFDNRYSKDKLDFIEKTLKIDTIMLGQIRKKFGIDKIMPLSIVKDYRRIYKLFVRKLKTFWN